MDTKYGPFFYDVTLRDGNQALKKPWGLRQKEDIFQRLLTLGVHGCELGFPASSLADFDSVVALAVKAPANLVVAGLARTNEDDVARAIEALSASREATRRLHTFIGMSPFHMQEVLRKSPDQVRKMAVDAVTCAQQGLSESGTTPWDVQFSVEHFGDCGDNLDWVIDCLRAIVEAGATVINLPNTVERYRPLVFVHMVSKVVAALGDQVTVAVHCHNDLGMATATTVESYFAGASQLEVTLNGLGERAGNANITEVATVLHCNGVNPRINLSLLYQESLSAAESSGIPIPEKAPLVGREVLIHRSGIHQSGAVRTSDQSKGAYRPIDPKLIGRVGHEQCQFTAQSGKAAVISIIREAGFDITMDEAIQLRPALENASQTLGIITLEEMAEVYQAFCDLSEQKRVEPEDLVALTLDVIHRKRGSNHWSVQEVEIHSNSRGVGAKSMARIVLSRNGDTYEQVALGDGAVDAAVKAINLIIPGQVRISEYHAISVTSGSDAQGRVSLFVFDAHHHKVGATGVDTCLDTAAVKAVISGINQLEDIA